MHFQAATLFPGDLFDAAARFAADHASPAAGHAGATTAPTAGPEPAALASDAWQQARAMGWPAMLVSEDLGGAGGSLADLAAVVEGCARHASGLPLVHRCAVVPALLSGAGGPAAQQALRALAGAQHDTDTADARGLQALDLPDGGVCLSGTLEGLGIDHPASHWLLVVGDRLLLVPAAQLPRPATRHRGIDGRGVADLQLQAVALPAAAVLQRGPAVSAAAATAADLGALVLAIEMVATLGALIEHTIAYLHTRTQFGVALATFQVLRHQVVELYVQYESASALLSRVVADTVATGQLRPHDASLAKLYLSDLARTGAEAAIQLHGGMGMTADLPATRLARRLMVAQFDHGSRTHHLQRLQQLRDQAAAGDAGAALRASATPASVPEPAVAAP